MSAIVVKDVLKKYDGEPVVKGVSFNIDEGEIFGLVGPNGAGKTTIIEGILGLRKFDGGEVVILGKKSKRGSGRTKKLLGAQLQEAMLASNIKVWEAVDLQAAYYGIKVNVDSELQRFELQEVRNKCFSKLSGGQKQRLFILLAVLHKPKVVFLDELSVGLDPNARKEIWGKILQLKKEGNTVVLSTHLMDEAEQLCDRVLLLNKGKIVDIDTPYNLISKIGVDTVVQFKCTDAPGEKFKGISNTVKCEWDQFGNIKIQGRGSNYTENVMAYLTNNNLKYSELVIKSPSLEEVFFEFTNGKE